MAFLFNAGLIGYFATIRMNCKILNTLYFRKVDSERLKVFLITKLFKIQTLPLFKGV